MFARRASAYSAVKLLECENVVDEVVDVESKLRILLRNAVAG
jgi:hypothetical protein